MSFSSRAARMVGEKNGILEYEYNSHFEDRQRLDSEDGDSMHSQFSEFDQQNHHMNAVIRGISLSRCPLVGFGFTLARSTAHDEDYIYVATISPESPAEFCLQLGNISFLLRA